MTHHRNPRQHPAWSRCIPRHLACLAALICLAVHLTPSPAQAQAKCSAMSARPEWRTLSQAQRQRFLTAVKKLQQRPAPGKPSKYDLLVKQRGDLGKAMVGNPLVLPWHRHYLRQFELELQKIDSTVTLPYWDWAFDSQAPEFSPVWGNDHFGGNGSGPSSCVTDGAFKDFQPMYPRPSCLSRSWNNGDKIGAFENNDSITAILNRTTGDYDSLRKSLEGAPAGLVHTNIGGAMRDLYAAPNDPLFFLVRANVDRHWARWQELSPKNKDTYGGTLLNNVPATSEDVMPGFTPSVKVKSVLDIRQLCYSYKDLPPNFKP